MINKDKNVMLQITISKELKMHLDCLVDAFIKEGIKVTKSQVLEASLKHYLEMILLAGTPMNEKEHKEERKC